MFIDQMNFCKRILLLSESTNEKFMHHIRLLYFKHHFHHHCHLSISRAQATHKFFPLFFGSVTIEASLNQIVWYCVNVHVCFYVCLFIQEDTAVKLVKGEKQLDDYDIPGVDMKQFINQIKENPPNHSEKNLLV